MVLVRTQVIPPPEWFEMKLWMKTIQKYAEKMIEVLVMVVVLVFLQVVACSILS